MITKTSISSKQHRVNEGANHLPYLIIFLVLLLFSISWNQSIAASQTDRGIIAYISSSVDYKEIRTIKPDGSQDKTLWKTPSGTYSGDDKGSLNWHPDGTELAFDSPHNWERSYQGRDLYAISHDGARFRRVTSPPGSEGFNDYPTGTVTFVVDAYEQGDVQIYIEGAKDPYKYVARLSKNYRVTLEVADWGEGVRQYMRLYYPSSTGSPCVYSVEGWVDVIPGKVTDLESVPFGQFDDKPCPRSFSPTWSHDGNSIIYMRRPPSSFPDNDILQITSHALPGKIGSTILDMSDTDFSDNVYRAVISPIAVNKENILFLYHTALRDYIYLTDTTIGKDKGSFDVGGCPQISCNILDVAWLPDGSGFIFTQYEHDVTARNNEGVLYRFTFSDKKTTPLVRLPGEIIGKLAISPDNSSIIFERAKSLTSGLNVVKYGPSAQCPCSLWIIKGDGSGLHQLVANGRAPAWGKTAAKTNNTDLPSIDAFYNWAESKFPQYFLSHQSSQEILGYYARHYPETDIYLGTKNKRVFVYGAAFGGLLDVGDLQTWLQRSAQ
ncbi:MAG: hypothetical protein V3U87_15425 [Methylococcaceae bacterium]